MADSDVSDPRLKPKLRRRDPNAKYEIPIQEEGRITPVSQNRITPVSQNRP